MLRAGLDAFNRRDKAAFLAICHSDIENVPPRDWPESEVAEGSETVWDFFVTNNDPWEDSPLEYLEIIDCGNDRIAAQMHGQMRGAASGAGVHWSFWQVATWLSFASTKPAPDGAAALRSTSTSDSSGQ